MESFEEWREKFRKEMEAMKGVVIKDIQSTQLTGEILPYYTMFQPLDTLSYNRQTNV